MISVLEHASSLSFEFDNLVSLKLEFLCEFGNSVVHLLTSLPFDLTQEDFLQVSYCENLIQRYQESMTIDNHMRVVPFTEVHLHGLNESVGNNAYLVTLNLTPVLS